MEMMVSTRCFQPSDTSSNFFDGCDFSLSVLKAQHGCIDCLAWIICAELTSPKPSKRTTSDNVGTEGSVCTYVIHMLTHKEHGLPFRLCMANVLISTCQKISDSGKHPLAQKVVPPIIRSARVR